MRHLRWLHAHGANLSQVASETGETPMHLAMSGGSLNAVAFLYKHGCAKDLSTAANNGRVPVLYAEEKGHIRLLRWHAEVQNGVNWTKDSPGMLVPEASLCPPPRPPTPEETDEEREARLKLDAKKQAMEDSGLDAENYAGYA